MVGEYRFVCVGVCRFTCQYLCYMQAVLAQMCVHLNPRLCQRLVLELPHGVCYGKSSYGVLES